ncbi:MAG: DUF3488 and transglutaminase-like domain-containing protein [Pseudomonadota bacterium]
MHSDGRLRHTLAWTIPALLVAYAPQVLTKPIWITVLIVGCALVRWLGEVRRARLTPGWVRTPIGVLCFIGVLQTYGSINGVAPGSALLCVMAALKLLETRSQRDQFVVLFICLFLILATFLDEQHLWSIVYLISSYTLAMAAWMAVSRQGAPRPRRWYLREAIKTVSFALPVLLAMWILFPRVPGPFWAIPTQTGSANTGLSSTMSPGDISSLSESQAVAFRVRFDSFPPSRQQLYWRAIIMQRFDGRSWSADEPRFTQARKDTITRRGNRADYTITMEPTNQHWLYALDMPVSWSGKGIYATGGQTLQRRKPVDDLFEYSVRSVVQYRANATLPRRSQGIYKQLPPDSNPEARAFAERESALAGSPEAFAARVLEYFTEEPFFYTLSPPALGRESVDEFLFSTRRGFCEHYASAFAFLMRAAGIPARVVAGYQGGTLNSLSDYWIVRQSDAHAWTEIWVAGKGWIRVDPTAAVAPERIERNLDSALRQIGERSPGNFTVPLVERMQLAWDMANARWDEWVLGFGPENQKNLMERLGLKDAGWKDLTAIMAIVLVSLMTTLSLWLWYRHLPPRRDKAYRSYLKLQRKLGLPGFTGEAPLAYAKRAAEQFPDDAQRIHQITHDYLYWRYAGQQQRSKRVVATLGNIGWKLNRRWRRRSQPARERATTTRR